MEPKQSHLTKIKLPDYMPPFSSENPIQALYLKKKGVERLLKRETGKSFGIDFAKETKNKIEKGSMLIDRRRTSVRKDDREEGCVFHRVLETIPSFDEEDEHQKLMKDNTVTEVSYYDSDEESDWTLPGVQEKATDIRYIYGDESYYDSKRREKHDGLYQLEQLESSKYMNPMEMITKYLTCHFEDRPMLYDW
eukprot:CAMPEP_0197174220 /NCGR_PEP_ID=MMETSP1423-20130617/838_1 /TAXON_ID=476441 /ORGANISM="Pseudo-nitzschia heimii, Strain UNC1101" /LENGTH=192 /DNA_ID=CAMNT_0042623123 /DNA_START=12 /DNA_END=587 /DNA_ORIENTATION=-